MKFSFKAKIYKVGINLCVKVPLRITKAMEPKRGYIPVSGTIEGYAFQQTLVPVKDNPYRLFVNRLMLTGSGMSLGKTARFVIEQNFSSKPRQDSRITPALKAKLAIAGLLPLFKKLTPSRQKEIIRYLYYLKTDEAKERNMNKIVQQLKSGLFH
jgi:hypothetical protein